MLSVLEDCHYNQQGHRSSGTVPGDWSMVVREVEALVWSVAFQGKNITTSIDRSIDHGISGFTITKTFLDAHVSVGTADQFKHESGI